MVGQPRAYRAAFQRLSRDGIARRNGDVIYRSRCGRHSRRPSWGVRSLHRVTTSVADPGSPPPRGAPPCAPPGPPPPPGGPVDEFAALPRRPHKPMDAIHVVGYFAPETT